MIYSYSYMLPQTPYGDRERYNEYAQRQGMRQIADMIYRDFKYQEYSVDHWTGQPQYRIELVVFSRSMFDMFLEKLEDIMTLTQSRQLLEFLNELQPDNENAKNKNEDNNRVQ